MKTESIKEIFTKVNETYNKKVYYNLMYLLINWIIIIGIISLSLIYNNIWVYILSILIIGSRIRGFANLIHEASHGNLIPHNKFLNKIFTNLFLAYPIFTSFSLYFNSHILGHHGHFQDKEYDPDMKRYIAVYGNEFVELKEKDYIKKVLNIRNFIVFSYLYPMRGIFQIDILMTYKYIILFWSIILSSLYITDTLNIFIMFWVVPYFTTYKIIAYIAEVFEHSGLYHLESKIKSTRNIYTNFIMRHLLWPHGDSYHLVHHLMSNIPGYSLKKANDYLLKNSSIYKSEHSHYYLVNFI